MKYIISTTGEQIIFNLNRDRKLIIDPVVPIEINIAELAILNTRLGAQIRVVSDQTPALVQEDKTSTESGDKTEAPMISSDDGIA